MSQINNAVKQYTDEYAGYYSYARNKLLDLTENLEFNTVLEIGCGSGENLSELKKRIPDLKTTGIEIREDLTEKLESNKSVSRFYIGDVCTILPNLSEKFDLIILSHVLEHFTDPDTILNLAKAKLTEDGYMLVALPNIKHLSVLIPLILHDRFTYASSGILDRTHLRFFTKSSSLQFFKDNSLKVLKVNPDINNGKSRLFDKLTFGIASSFCAFAYNFLIKPE